MDTILRKNHEMSAIFEVSRVLTASFKMFRRSEDECGTLRSQLEERYSLPNIIGKYRRRRLLNEKYTDYLDLEVCAVIPCPISAAVLHQNRNLSKYQWTAGWSLADETGGRF